MIKSMKVKFKYATLLVVLSLMAASCQKETFVDSPNAQIQQSVSIRNVTYTIDGATMHTTIMGDIQWREFVDWLFALAEEGHQVRFRNECYYNNQQNGKDVVTYSTTDKEKANNWAAEMTENGYEVTIEYDRTTGLYTCTAIK